jgi:hypothetical protein
MACSNAAVAKRLARLRSSDQPYPGAQTSPLHSQPTQLGNLHWQDFHLLDHQLASLHHHRALNSQARSVGCSCLEPWPLVSLGSTVRHQKNW